MIDTDEGPYEYVEAYVEVGGIRLEYKCEDLSIAGSDFIDDPSVEEWSEQDIRDVVAAYLNVNSGADEIDIIY